MTISTPEHRLEGAQHALAAQHQAGVRAQAAQDTRQFHGDVAAAHDRHPLRPARQLEEAIRGDAELGAGELRQQRPAPGGEDDVRGAEGAVAGSDGVRIDEMPARAHEFDVALGEVRRVHPVQAVYVGVPPALELAPVMTQQLDLEAVALRILHGAAQVRGVPHDLLRHAADVHAGAAQGTGLDQRDARAVLGRALRGGQPAAAAADRH
jgi:hypothetical protein